MSIPGLRILLEYPELLALAGLILGIRGALLVAFKGFMAEMNYTRLFASFFFPKLARNQPMIDPGPRMPWLEENEKRGWRSIVWGFTLQAIAIVLKLTQ